jgi:hypothetical protein
MGAKGGWRAPDHSWMVPVQGLKTVGQPLKGRLTVLAPPACCCGYCWTPVCCCWALCCCCVGPPPSPLPPPRLLRRLGLEPVPFPAPPEPELGADLVVAASAAAGDGWRLPKVSSSKDRSEEGGEGVGAPQQGTDVREALVEATNHVEDEGAVGDDLSQGSEIVGHLLQTAAVLGDGEIALHEVAKLHLELDRPCLLIAQELGFDGEPGVPGRGALGGDDLGEVVGERAEDPGLDNAVHLSPVRRGDRGVEEDVRLEGEFAEDQQELIAPTVEVAGVDVENDVDEAPDVVDGDGLGVKV